MDGVSVQAGSARHPARVSPGVDVPEEPVGAETRVHVALGGRLPRADRPVPIRRNPTRSEAVAALRAQGVRVAMLSGDGPGPVAAVAETLGIPEAHGGLSPADKKDLLEQWRAEGLKVAFVGDGINDAPVLAAADVGVALGTGTDVAIEAAHVVLVSGRPSAVVTARDVSRRTLANIVQNLVWAFGYNVGADPGGRRGGLAIFGGPFLNPMLAAGAMAGKLHPGRGQRASAQGDEGGMNIGDVSDRTGAAGQDDPLLRGDRASSRRTGTPTAYRRFETAHIHKLGFLARGAVPWASRSRIAALSSRYGRIAAAPRGTSRRWPTGTLPRSTARWPNWRTCATRCRTSSRPAPAMTDRTAPILKGLAKEGNAS